MLSKVAIVIVKSKYYLEKNSLIIFMQEIGLNGRIIYCALMIDNVVFVVLGGLLMRLNIYRLLIIKR
jgi:hypothetical protein